MVPKQIDIVPEVMDIARRLNEAGHDTWCVGGAVRDFLLGIANNDVDLATAATPKEIQALFRRTVPVGIEHGTIVVLDRRNVAHEVTTFRKDIKTDGRHALVEFGVQLEEDLARRDFTINAIAYHPLRHEWRDPHNGMGDIEAGLVRAVGAPDQRFREDYLRILRCIRFVTRFAFSVDNETWRAAVANADGLRQLSAERVRDEWFKSFRTTRSVVELCRYWNEIGADRLWLSGVQLDDNTTRRRAAMLERNHDDPVFGTAFLSATPQITLQTLRCSNIEIERGRRIGAHREQWPDPSVAIAVRRWMADVGSGVDDLMHLAELEGVAAGLRDAVREVRASGAPLSQADLAVDGADLLRAGIPEGPQMGVVLRRLLDTVLDEPHRNTREDLLRIAGEVGGGG